MNRSYDFYAYVEQQMRNEIVYIWQSSWRIGFHHVEFLSRTYQELFFKLPNSKPANVSVLPSIFDPSRLIFLQSHAEQTSQVSWYLNISLTENSAIFLSICHNQTIASPVRYLRFKISSDDCSHGYVPANTTPFRSSPDMSLPRKSAWSKLW